MNMNVPTAMEIRSRTRPFAALEDEILLHDHFVVQGHEAIEYERGRSVPRKFRVAAIYGVSQGWLRRDIGWSDDFNVMVWQLTLTVKGKERFFNRHP